MRVYKYYPAHWGRQDILRQRLKLTTLDDINDPFEFRAIGTKEKSLRRILEKWRIGLPGQLGLIAFCENRENPVIWSHYTDSYRGICLGFDIPAEYLLPVKYVPERVVMTLKEVTDKLASGGFQDLLTTKFEHWSYEALLRKSRGGRGSPCPRSARTSLSLRLDLTKLENNDACYRRFIHDGPEMDAAV